jgi:hypothetical protein
MRLRSLAVSTKARLKADALPVARLGETRAYDLMLTQFGKTTLVVATRAPVGQRRWIRLTCGSQNPVEREGSFFTVSSAFFKLMPLLPAHKFLIVHMRGMPKGDESLEHWRLYYE